MRETFHDVFSMIAGIDISYKIIERLYSDHEITMALHNLYVIMLGDNGVRDSNATGDSPGYPFTVTKHYQSYAQKLKDRAKEQD